MGSRWGTQKQGEALRPRDSEKHQKHRDKEEWEMSGVQGTWRQEETNRDREMPEAHRNI